jgi:hypothetical protein
MTPGQPLTEVSGHATNLKLVRCANTALQSRKEKISDAGQIVHHNEHAKSSFVTCFID